MCQFFEFYVFLCVCVWLCNLKKKWAKKMWLSVWIALCIAGLFSIIKTSKQSSCTNQIQQMVAVCGIESDILFVVFVALKVIIVRICDWFFFLLSPGNKNLHLKWLHVAKRKSKCCYFWNQINVRYQAHSSFRNCKFPVQFIFFGFLCVFSYGFWQRICHKK